MATATATTTATTTTTTTTDVVANNEEKDVRWTDAQVRWPEDEVKPEGTSDDDDDDDDYNPFDPFADPDPHEIFKFRFVTNKKKKSTTTTTTTEPIEQIATENDDDDDDESIRLDIHGYKTASDQVWESTGLTLWKASTYLCDYMVQHADELKGQRVLELGAGLGLNGVLAHRLSADSVVITDGDSDAMVELRKNIVVNRRIQDNNNNDDDDEDAASKNKKALSAAQLIWGLESSRAFLENIVTTTTTTASSLSSSQFSIIIASDVIYAAIVIDPLWETVRTLLRKPGGEFWMAFAVRKVPVTIEFVLQKAQEYGFRYELVDRQQQQQQSNGDKDGVEGNPETGPVFIYVFRWDVEGSTEGVDNDSNTTPAIEES